jgi:hypothetical protein
MKDSDTKITIGGNVSKLFDGLQGVRRGDGLSAVLLNLALDKLLKGLNLMETYFLSLNRRVLMLMT